MRSVVAIVGLLVLAGVGVACSGGSNDGRSVSKQEIVATLTPFVEAFTNGDEAAMRGFLSKDCTPAEAMMLQSISQLLHSIFVGGEFHLMVDTGSFVMELKDHQVIVPLDQPEGALSATMTINGQTAPDYKPLPFKTPIEFVQEDGAWKLHNCGGLFPRGGNETPATAIP